MNDPLSTIYRNIINSNLGRIAKPKVTDVAPTLDDPMTGDEPKSYKPVLLTSLLAGATAGFIVDITLFPLDTIKTRLQSQYGFKASGGFKGVYKGLGPVVLGSAPVSAIFFGTYNGIVNQLRITYPGISNTLVNFVAASVSEVIGSLLRVPLEVVKQRKQITTKQKSSWAIMRKTISKEGIGGLYRGFSFASTVSREIPFSAIQFPLWEYLKVEISKIHRRPVTTLEVACCGAAAGGISAAVTTPMDVIKTRIMLEEKEMLEKLGKHTTYNIAKGIFQQQGLSGLFAGIVPRVLWITLGGFIYFGVYELVTTQCGDSDVIYTKKEDNEESMLLTLLNIHRPVPPPTDDSPVAEDEE